MGWWKRGDWERLPPSHRSFDRPGAASQIADEPLSPMASVALHRGKLDLAAEKPAPCSRELATHTVSVAAAVGGPPATPAPTRRLLVALSSARPRPGGHHGAPTPGPDRGPGRRARGGSRVARLEEAARGSWSWKRTRPSASVRRHRPKPSHELLGEVLLELGRHEEEARDSFRTRPWSARRAGSASSMPSGAPPPKPAIWRWRRVPSRPCARSRIVPTSKWHRPSGRPHRAELRSSRRTECAGCPCGRCSKLAETPPAFPPPLPRPRSDSLRSVLRASCTPERLDVWCSPPCGRCSKLAETPPAFPPPLPRPRSNSLRSVLRASCTPERLELGCSPSGCLSRLDCSFKSAGGFDPTGHLRSGCSEDGAQTV